jgi:predicted nucleic acid-binding protein
MPRPLEVQFDTSALSNLLRSDITQERLDEVLRRWHAVIVINHVSFGQLFSDLSTDRVSEHLRRMKNLGFGRFRVAVSTHRMKVLERRRVPLSGTPTLANCTINQVLDAPDGLSGFRTFHRQVAQELLERNDTSVLQRADRQLAEAFRHPTDTESRARAALKEWYAYTVLNLTRPGAVLIDDFLAYMVDSKESREQMHRDPSKYKVHMLTASYIALNSIGCYLNDAHTPEYPWLRRETDNWNDANIAATAAHASILITDDRNMRGRLHFLESQGLAFVRTLSLEDFLA